MVFEPNIQYQSPRFLLAPPHLQEGFFAGAAILVVAHESEGAMGFVINKSSELTFHEVCRDLKLETKIPNQTVLAGGPVSDFAGFVLYEHSPQGALAPGIAVTNTISISPSQEALDAASSGRLNSNFELLLGYAGWGPGQLDEELQQSGWLEVDFDPSILFDVHFERRLAALHRRLGYDPAALVHVDGGAQA